MIVVPPKKKKQFKPMRKYVSDSSPFMTLDSILFRDEILHSDADREMAFKLRDEYISAIESSMNER